jgi:pimeloyl-ACP methyl ester carboxylesterase
MAFATLDGIKTRYEVVGEGEPLLMFSPGGFDATLDKWRSLGIYAKTKILDHLAARFACILFDRRETGQSGGRVEHITWASYVAQGKALLDELGIKSAHIMGGCMGVCPATAFGVTHPQMTRSMVLFWPVGGARYRMNGHQRFGTHAAFVREKGLTAVIERAKASGKSFGEDPCGSPWASVIRSDEEFARAFAAMDPDWYQAILTGALRSLFDRDTAPGAEPEDMLALNTPALIVPGHDASHATSAARYLEECLPASQYWDVAVGAQTEDPVRLRLIEFLEGSAASRP